MIARRADRPTAITLGVDKAYDADAAIIYRESPLLILNIPNITSDGLLT
jgi:hypothetical protein